MIVILTGAIKNTGDYLIADRAKKLFRKFLDRDIIELNRFEPINDHLDIINKSRALVLCGGPAYTRDIFDGIYDISSVFDKIHVPVIPFGLGWCGDPYPNSSSFSFSDLSLQVIKKIHSAIPFSSCRDVITQQILNKHGINNVRMTGCPVWYDLDYINRPLRKVESFRSIVITTPAQQAYLLQTIQLINLVKSKFTNSKLYLSFHRGILPGLSTPPRKGLAYSIEALAGLMKGFGIRDVSGDINKINFYDECDLHIGYRVHAHLYFLSKRIPSFLINEDGRGYAFSKTLEFPEFNGYDKNTIRELSNTIDQGLDTNFNILEKAIKNIDVFYHENMVSFIKETEKFIK